MFINVNYRFLWVHFKTHFYIGFVSWSWLSINNLNNELFGKATDMAP